MSNQGQFVGGIRLPRYKLASAPDSLEEAKLPKQLIYPLTLRDGQNLEPLVRQGQRVLKGQALVSVEDLIHPPVHAASSGWVKAIEVCPLPYSSGGEGLGVVIETDGQDEAIEYAGFKNFTTATPDALRRLIHRAGLVGMGGAGFPTRLKVDPPPFSVLDTLILNAAECEPHISCDESLLCHWPRAVLGGVAILRQLLGVGRCLLAIEDDRRECLAPLFEALEHSGHERVDIVTVPTIYPAGGEKQLIKVLTGREVPTGGLPAEVGVICLNVATVAAIHLAVTEGEPLLSRIVTVTGPGVRQPKNLLVRLGTPVADLIRQCGGYTTKARRLIMGGPMMGRALPTDEVPITPTSNCILVEEAASARLEMPCIRCGHCVEVCPMSLLPQQLLWHGQAHNLERLAEYHLSACIECGCCDLVCPSHIPLSQQFHLFKANVVLKEQARLRASHARQRYESRQLRKEQERVEKADSAKRKKALLLKALGGHKDGSV